MTDYLSAAKRAQVEEMKRRILAGEFNTPGAGFTTAVSTTIPDLVAQAVIQDEQGPWSLEDPHTEREIAQYELALADHDAKVRADEASCWAQAVIDAGKQGERIGAASALRALIAPVPATETEEAIVEGIMIRTKNALHPDRKVVLRPDEFRAALLEAVRAGERARR